MTSYLEGGLAVEYARESWGLKVKWATVDFEADMGYISVREHDSVGWVDVSMQGIGIILDRGTGGELLGIELFLRDGLLRPETLAEVKRILAWVERRGVAS